MIKRCTKCILPETVPNITFDDAGVCNYCNKYIQEQDTIACNKTERGRILANLIEEARKRRTQGESKYDVLVPISGGRDSSYVAWALTVDKKLKVLGIHYDNPFSSRQARRNVDRLANELDLNIITYRWPGKRHERSFENNLKAWLKKPDLGSMGLLCLACKPMYLKFFQIAKKDNIHLIIDGSNPNEATQFKLEAKRIGDDALGTVLWIGFE